VRRMPGKPLEGSGTGLPGGVKMQNKPASSVIKWPDTFSSVVGFGPCPACTVAGADGVFVSLTVDYLASELAPDDPPGLQWPCGME
jgi:hypothetical protein